jgi:hypothetical protein
METPRRGPVSLSCCERDAGCVDEFYRAAGEPAREIRETLVLSIIYVDMAQLMQ